MATFTVFHEFMLAVGSKKINLAATDVFKAMLTNVAPTQAGSLIKTDITEITAANGYTAGGVTLTTTFTETAGGSGIWRFQSTGADPSWTAAGGSIAAHQYLVVYDDTATNKDLVGFINQGSSSVIADGNTRTWDIGASGLFEISATP